MLLILLVICGFIGGDYVAHLVSYLCWFFFGGGLCCSSC